MTVEEAKKEFPIGTVFIAAHINSNNTVYATTIQEGDDYYKNGNGNILIKRDGRTSDPKNGYEMLLWYDSTKQKAKIISKPDIVTKSLPKNWQLLITSINIDAVNEYRNKRGQSGKISSDYSYPFLMDCGSCAKNSAIKPELRITDEQFTEITGIKIMKSTPSTWTFKITEKNLKAVNEYRHIQSQTKFDKNFYPPFKNASSYEYIRHTGEGTNNAGNTTISDAEFVTITGIKIDDTFLGTLTANKTVPIPDGKLGCVQIICTKDCKNYKIGDVTWVTNSYLEDGKLDSCVHPESNRYGENYYECFTLLHKLSNKIIPIPNGRKDCIEIICTKDCKNYTKGDITWIKTDYYYRDGVLDQTICPEDNKNYENYYQCFELLNKSIIKEIELNPATGYPKDLGDIQFLEFHPKILDRIVELSIAQSIEPFIKNRTAGRSEKGFIHSSSPEGDIFWTNVLHSRNPEHFYTKYPREEVSIGYMTTASVGSTGNSSFTKGDKEPSHSFNVSPRILHGVMYNNSVITPKTKKQPIQVEMIPVKQRRII